MTTYRIDKYTYTGSEEYTDKETAETELDQLLTLQPDDMFFLVEVPEQAVDSKGTKTTQVPPA